MEVGLCRRCRFAHVISTDASTFHRCMLHEEAPDRFPRYPKLPVVDCEGFEPGSPERSG